MRAEQTRRSSSSSFIPLSSSLPFLAGALPRPLCLSFFGQLHVTFNRGIAPTLKVRAACISDVPRRTASMIFCLRSTEYAFIFRCYAPRPTPPQHAVGLMAYSRETRAGWRIFVNKSLSKLEPELTLVVDNA